MKTQKLSTAAEIWLALKMDKFSAIRKAAATVCFDYLIEQHINGYFPPYQAQIDRISKRFNLGEWLLALSAHYPVTA